MFKLFVSGFPLKIVEIELVKWFFPHGNVRTVKIIRDKKTRICKGYAFLEMDSQQGADEAIIALDGKIIGDRNLTVRPAVEPVLSIPVLHTPVYKKSDRKPEAAKTKRPRLVL